LHAGCGQRIEYRKWCPKHGAVSPDEIVKGYPYQPDQYVEFSPTELEQLQPADDKTIHLEHFLKPSCFDPVLFAGRSLYLAPANSAALRPFATIQRAIDRRGKWGIGRVVLSNRRHILVVRPVEDKLMMHTLHHPAQVRAIPAQETADVRCTQTELRPITQTISRLNGHVNWASFEDDTEPRLVEAVRAKVSRSKRAKPTRANGKRPKGNGRITKGVSRRQRAAA
jgi:DNA end-binding protein Ku